MASATVVAWTACIQEVQQLVDLATEQQVLVGSGMECFQRVTELVQQSPLPHAALKKLVQDIKVTFAGHQHNYSSVVTLLFWPQQAPCSGQRQVTTHLKHYMMVSALTSCDSIQACVCVLLPPTIFVL